MIEVIQEPLTEEKQDKIRAWLISPESQWVEELVKGQIAELIAQGGNAAMNVAGGVLSLRDVPPETKEKMAGAATLELFLATIGALRKQETFVNVSLKIK